MPSLRKRSPKSVANGGPVISQQVVDAALDDAQRVADAVPPNAEAASAVPSPSADDSAALRSQLTALRAAEEQAQRAQEVQAQISAGMGPRDGVAPAVAEAQQQHRGIEFTAAEDSLYAAYPALLSDPAHAQAASSAVAQLAQMGMQRGSKDYEENLRPTFEGLLVRTKQAAAPRPESIAEPASMAEPAEPRIPVSAPVSRSVPLGDLSPTMPSKVTLSAQEREHARLAGVPEVEYARQKIRLQALKQSGHYREEG